MTKGLRLGAAFLFAALLAGSTVVVLPGILANPLEETAGRENDSGFGKILAKVNDQPITKEDLYLVMLKKYGEQELSELIAKTLLEQEENKHEVTASREEMEKKLDLYIDQKVEREKRDIERQAQGALTFEQYIKQRFNQTVEEYKTAQRRKLVESTPNVYEMMRHSVIVEKLVKYYELTHERASVAHILVQTEAEAKDLLKKLAEGKSFSELAKAHSLDPYTRESGGAVPSLIIEGDSRYRLSYFGPELDMAALALQKPGEVSQPVKTSYGWHIIQLLEKHEAKQGSFKDLKKEVIEQTEKTPTDAAEQEKHLVRLMTAAKIENLSDLKLKFLEYLEEKKGAESP